MKLHAPKPKQKNFCDVCKKEIERNTTFWNLKVHPSCGYPIQFPKPELESKSDNWEDEFEGLLKNTNLHHEELPCYNDHLRVHSLKSFISNLLLQQKEEVVKTWDKQLGIMVKELARERKIKQAIIDLLNEIPPN